jgi:hypothetical protein
VVCRLCSRAVAATGRRLEEKGAGANLLLSFDNHNIIELYAFLLCFLRSLAAKLPPLVSCKVAKEVPF